MNDSNQSLSLDSTLQNGKYVIKSVLGQGGFGITYLAHHTVLEKDVAIKEFFPSMFCEREENSSVSCSASNGMIMQKLKAKFTKEVKHIASLKHPNIITVFDIFEENGTAYYVMDYIDGLSLHDMVKHSGALPSVKIIKYIGEIGSALDYIHSLRIGHYDVKPGNILIINSTDQSVLIDFGLSKQFTENDDEQTSSLIGHSNGYAPIEQYDQSSKLVFSPTTDTYSLTATLFFLLSGIRPQTSTEIVSQGLKIPDVIPDKLKRIIRKGMSIQQDKRYKSCKDLYVDLENALSSNRSIEIVNNVWDVAKNGLKRKNSQNEGVVFVLQAITQPRDSTNIQDNEREESIVKRASVEAGLHRSKKQYKQIEWIQNHPRIESYGLFSCNILIRISIALGVCECLNLIKRIVLIQDRKSVV